MNKKPNAIIIMDGYGLAPNSMANAIEASGSPNIKQLSKTFPSTTLGASGMDVGLPDGQMGNSEVGHLNIGAGRIVYQELTRITKSIKDSDFFANEELLSAVKSAKKSGKKFHIMGLLSHGGVHSHIEHLYALLNLAKNNGLENAYVHCFMDGRDVSPTSGEMFIKDLTDKMSELNYGKIATICGRYYAMDRDNRWDRVEKAYNMLTLGSGLKANDPLEVMQNAYAENITDEFILPVNITQNNNPIGLIEKGDSVVFFNFRPDRARQLTRAITEKTFDNFNRDSGYLNTKFVTFTQYDITFKNVSVAFKPQSLNNTLGEYLAFNGLNQLRIAETEKYAHVTFFFNGGVEKPNINEERALISSPKVATYDMKPEMSALEVTEKVIEEIDSNKHDVIILNFANCDMVGHTGNMTAAKKAVKTVDDCVKKVVDKILSLNGNALITADHGNADKMFEEDGSPFTAHTTNPVPLILVGNSYKASTLKTGGRLADIAPTLLDILGLEKPAEMTGTSLIERKQ